MRRVIIESPYAGEIDLNLRYLRAAMAHSLSIGEAPFASHALYTQEGVLRDYVPEERSKGICTGYAWGEVAHLVAFYEDLGWSRGMNAAWNRYIMYPQRTRRTLRETQFWCPEFQRVLPLFANPTKGPQT